MKKRTALEELTSGELLFVSVNSNSPFWDECRVESETTKAVLLRNTYNNFACWFPKSAFEWNNSKTALTIKSWFRKKLISNKETFPFKVLGH